MQPPLKQDHTMNTPISLEPGVYVNIFPVTIPEESVHFMVASRGKFPDLRSLRKRIQDEDWNTQVYAHGNKVYGYRAEMEYLLHEGFEEEILYLADFPQLTARLVEEGILRLLSTEGYEARVGKGL